jgi:hypothetical protein
MRSRDGKEMINLFDFPLTPALSPGREKGKGKQMIPY